MVWNTTYSPLDGSPLNDDLAGINVGADMKGSAETVVYQRVRGNGKRYVCLEGYRKIFRVQANKP